MGSGIEGADSSSSTSDILVVSWNCGGFIPTHKLIKAHYGSFETYLHRVGAGIFCMQETKVGRHLLQNANDARLHGAKIDGFKSFWSFNDLNGRVSGLNGVATWVKEDLAAVNGVKATQDVLQDALDQEGRCLLVDLGGLAVLNVYAPHVSDSDEAPQEMLKDRKSTFMELMHKAILKLENLGKHVILCGDLNLTYRAADCALSRRWVKVGNRCVVDRPDWTINEEEESWMKVVAVITRLSFTCKAPSADVHLVVPLLSANLEVMKEFTMGGRPISVGRVLLAVNGVRATSMEAVQAELRKSSEVELEFGVREADLALISHSSHSIHDSRNVDMLKGMLKPQGSLVDTFLHVHPDAVDRFTCWNQALNLRYSNCGARLDYILCDADLTRALVTTPSHMLYGGSPGYNGSTSQAALDAATCFGRWSKAPRKDLFGGEAIGLSMKQDDMALNDLQFLPPHTGFIYTPPSYSDHIAACALFRGHGILKGSLHLSERDTKRCMPWVSQPSLQSFFGRGTKRSCEETTA